MKKLLASVSALSLLLAYAAPAAASPLSMTIDRTANGGAGPYPVCANPAASAPNVCAKIGTVGSDGSYTPVLPAILANQQAIGSAPAALVAATAAYVRRYGAGYTSVLACFDAFTDGSGPSRINDYLARSLLYFYDGAGAAGSDGYTLQQCLSGLGDRQAVLWPAGSMRAINLKQSGPWNGVAAEQNAGTVLFAPQGATTPLLTASSSVEGFSFIGGGQAAGHYLVYVPNTHVKLRRNFFQSGAAQVAEDKGAYYLDISENLFYADAAYHILTIEDPNYGTANPPVYPQGVDLIVRGNRFLSGGSGAPMQQGFLFQNLGSLVWDHNIASVENPTGPLAEIRTVAQNYGGTQVASSVFESNNPTQPVFYLHGTSSKPITLFQSVNTWYTGSGGGAVKMDYTSKPTFTGGLMSDTTRPINFAPFTVNSDVSLLGVDLEGNSANSPITSSGANDLGMNLSGSTWGGSAPIVDFSASTGGNPTLVRHFEMIGGNPGSAPVPVVLPSATTSFLLMYQGTVSIGKSLTVGGALNLGGTFNANQTPSAGPSLVAAGVTIAGGASYPLGMGSGFVFIGDQNGAGGASFYVNGANVVAMGASNAAEYVANGSATTGGKIGLAFDSGSSRYRITNGDTASHSFRVWTMQLRDVP